MMMMMMVMMMNLERHLSADLYPPQLAECAPCWLRTRAAGQPGRDGSDKEIKEATATLIS